MDPCIVVLNTPGMDDEKLPMDGSGVISVDMGSTAPAPPPAAAPAAFPPAPNVASTPMAKLLEEGSTDMSPAP